MKKLYSVASICIMTLAVLFAVSCNKHGQDGGGGEIAKRYQVLDGSKDIFPLKEVGNLITELSDSIITEDLIKLAKTLGILDEDQYKTVMTLFTDTTKFGTCVIKYRSTGIAGNEVWLTGRLVYDVDEKGDIIQPDHILLSCHYTQTDNKEVPSQNELYGLDAILATHGALVVAPDYLGYGIPGEGNIVDHPYCIPSITAINCLDMVRAAKDYFSSLALKTDTLKLYNQGYSQGGISSLAVTRYIQEHNLQSEFKLANTFCGAGPYSIKTMQELYVQRDSISYPVVYPLIVIGLKTAFPDVLTAELKDYFTQKAIDKEVIKRVKDKDTFIFDLNDEILDALEDGGAEKGFVKASSIVSADAFNPEKQLYKQIYQAAEKCEMASGWKPETHVHFVHGTHDDIVPYFNFELAQKNLKNDNTFFESYDNQLGHAANAGLFFMWSFLGEYKTVYGPDGNIIEK